MTHPIASREAWLEARGDAGGCLDATQTVTLVRNAG